MNDPKQLAEFLAAVESGSAIIAHPETAALMRPILSDVQDCKWLDKGVVYAVDFGRFQFPSDDFLLDKLG